MNNKLYITFNVFIVLICCYMLYQNIFVRQVGMNITSITVLLLGSSSIVAIVRVMKEKVD